VFLHYRFHHGPEPELGYESNAFPEVVLGDFGKACEANENPRNVQLGAWGRAEREEWQDTYSLFGVVKAICCSVLQPGDPRELFQMPGKFPNSRQGESVHSATRQKTVYFRLQALEIHARLHKYNRPQDFVD
jgi:hypothetical protein